MGPLAELDLALSVFYTALLLGLLALSTLSLVRLPSAREAPKRAALAEGQDANR
jgi:hypothetical protein